MKTSSAISALSNRVAKRAPWAVREAFLDSLDPAEAAALRELDDMGVVVMRTSATTLSLATLVRASARGSPPAMVASITEWVLAVQAARGIETLEDSIESAQGYRKAQSDQLKEFTDALAEWKADPTSFKKYKAAHELTWALGSHPGTRWSVRDFQKMTPEKREALTERSLQWIARLEERIEQSLSWGENRLPE